jgi:hypothetical protein
LIDEDDVAISLDGTERGAHLTGELRRALAGPAGEKDERVAGDGTHRREHDNPQADLTAGFGGPVLKDGQGSAVGVGGTIGARAGMKTVERAVAGSTSAGRGAPEHQDEHEARDETWEARHRPPGAIQVRG